MNLAVLWPSEYITDQYGADGKQGRIKEPTLCVLAPCQMHLGIRQGGGQTQLMSPSQSQVKASTASISGHHHRELNQAICEFSWLAN